MTRISSFRNKGRGLAIVPKYINPIPALVKELKTYIEQEKNKKVKVDFEGNLSPDNIRRVIAESEKGRYVPSSWMSRVVKIHEYNNIKETISFEDFIKGSTSCFNVFGLEISNLCRGAWNKRLPSTVIQEIAPSTLRITKKASFDRLETSAKNLETPTIIGCWPHWSNNPDHTPIANDNEITDIKVLYYTEEGRNNSYQSLTATELLSYKNGTPTVVILPEGATATGIVPVDADDNGGVIMGRWRIRHWHIEVMDESGNWTRWR